MDALESGARVTTPSGAGTVSYVRMAPPLYATVEVVSVRLDHEDGPDYAGTIFPASDVEVVK